MTTTVAPPRHRRPEPRRASGLTGTLGLLRLYLRRDRIVLPLWVLLLSVPLASVYIGSIETVFPTAAQRAAFAASIMASPAQRALYGNVYNDSVGAVGLWKAGVFHALIGVAVILTVIRHTRAEEESGRIELLDSTAVGRYAKPDRRADPHLRRLRHHRADRHRRPAHHRRAALPARWLSAWHSPALASSSRAVAAVPAQLEHRRPHRARNRVRRARVRLRATRGRRRECGQLSWLSPLGWSLQVRPYAGERWWVLRSTWRRRSC